MNRREMVKGGVATVALLLARLPESLWAIEPGEESIPFLDIQPPGKMLRWENLDSWITPTRDIFAVSHYGQPTVDLDNWSLKISGLVRAEQRFSLHDLQQMKRKEIIATLECSGNSSNPGFAGAIGNIRWAGTPLKSLLRHCGLDHRAREIVFFGADEKTEKIREKDYLQNFARSLSLEDALRDDVILAYEMNGQPLEKSHGAPLRLVVPGWFGIAWIKWLNRIEVLDRRFMSKYMAREYVTIRGQEKDGKTVWRETSVGPLDVKSAVARAARRKNGDVRFYGAAWTDGTPLRSVQIKIDEQNWKRVTLDRRRNGKYAWTFWHYDWTQAPTGDHYVVSRAIDTEGRVQPAADDPEIKLKRTYWEANQQWPRKIRI